MTLFKQANAALRDNRFEAAIALYVQSLQATPALSQFLLPNLEIAQERYRKVRSAQQQPHVITAGWNLAQNAAGRVITLAQIYQPLATVEIIGCFFPKWGYEVWQPIRSQPIPVHSIAIKDESQFIQQATELVLRHPCDVLHLSKPRAPNILIGLLYKLIWKARVIVDIDDEELAFVSATEPIALNAYLKAHTNLPELRDLTSETWTRIAVGLASAFDGVTVANLALQQRYGGTIVRHARDEKLFVPTAARRQQNRTKLNIPESEKVVLFLGTPRQHKGLLDTARAIASLKRQDVRLVIVGDFPKETQTLKAEIQALPNLKAQFLGNQALDTVPDIVSVGDVCMLLHDSASLAAQFQTPAKLSDALAMGLTVLAEITPGLADLAEQGAFRPVTRTTLASELKKALSETTTVNRSHPVFVTHLSMDANRAALAQWLSATRPSMAGQLNADLRTLTHKLSELAYLGKKPGNSHAPIEAIAHAKTSSFDMTGPVSIAATVQQANDAMAQDDWCGAYGHWKSLLDRPGALPSIDLLLRISRELFKLDAFPEAALALMKVASQNPNHPGLISEQAQQYYYHCYSSWLMLVTENEPDWYKVDGLDKRPDWKTACELIERAEKIAPRNNLRRYVQAYLLLAEDAWDKQLRAEARAALRTALNAIGPRKLDKALNQVIFEAVDEFRNGRTNERDTYFEALRDMIKAMPLESLEVQDWLCLNDILNWNGLLLCGRIARELALDLAILLGKKNPYDKVALKTALKAAFDRNDVSQADEYLDRLKQIRPNDIDIRELESCCELMKGNLEAFRQKWPHLPTPAEQRMRDYVRGKSVAVIGPASKGSLKGDDIDRFDVIVRTNLRKTLDHDHSKEFGAKSNISIYNAHSIRLLNYKYENTSFDDLNYIFVRRPFHNHRRMAGNQMKFVNLNDNPSGFYKTHNSFQAVVIELLRSGVDRLEIKNIDFYTQQNHHVNGYRNELASNISGHRRIQPILANHDLLGQFNVVKMLCKTGLINASDSISKILNLNSDAYLDQIACLKHIPTNISKISNLSATDASKQTTISYNYFKFKQMLASGDEKGALDCIGNRGSKARKSLSFRRVWPKFETARNVSPPSQAVSFCTVATTKFVPGLEALILCLLDLYPRMTSDFYVFHDGSLTEFAKHRLLKFYAHFIFVSADPVKYQELLGNEANHKRVGALGYLNLEALKLKQYKRVVILDCDILVLNDISVLWDPNCENPRVVMDAGIRPFGIISEYTKKPIINSGVISLPQSFINDNAYSRAMECIKSLNKCNCEVLNSYADQKFWNIFLSECSVTYLPQNYNAIKTFVERFYPGQISQVAILHFTGAKPWFFYSSHEDIDETDIKGAKDTRKSHPISFGIWERQVTALMCKYRRKMYINDMGASLDRIKNTASGKSCLLIGNGPSLSNTDLHAFKSAIKVCFNWFVHHSDFDTIKPDHYILPSHQLFGGWYTYKPKFPDGFISALLKHKHKPKLWISFYFKEYIETIPELAQYEVEYFLFEKPYKFFADHVGWMGVDMYDFLSDNRTGVLNVGVPLAIHLGVSEILLTGCDSNYSASKDDHFYDGALHTSKSTNSKSLVATWDENGPGFECYKIADTHLQTLGIKLIDTTVGGRLNFLNRRV